MASVGHVLAREPVHGKRVSPCAPQWQRPPSPLLRAWEGPFPRSSQNVCLPPWRPQGGGGSRKRSSRRARNCLASADLLPKAAGGKPELHAASPFPAPHPEAPSPGISPQAPTPPLPRPRVTNGMESCSDVPRALPCRRPPCSSRDCPAAHQFPFPPAEDARAPAGLVSGWPGPGFSGSVPQTSDLGNAGSCRRWERPCSAELEECWLAPSKHQPHSSPMCAAETSAAAGAPAAKKSWDTSWGRGQAPGCKWDA